MSRREASSLQARRRNREQALDFTGREQHLDAFRRNLTLSPDDGRYRYIFAISGQGGVGKTWLLKRCRYFADNAGCASAWSNDAQIDVPDTMGRIAEQFAQRDHPFKPFNERYRVYQQRRQELEADPEMPQGLPALLGRTLAKTALGMGSEIPGAGLALSWVDKDALATQAGEWATFVAKKLTNKDEIRLVRHPVDELTPLFLDGLWKVAENSSIALFFDTYERTSAYLDDWIRLLLQGHYGDVPDNIVLAIAGRDQLDANLWQEYEALGWLTPVHLEPFSESEARDYLARKNITDVRVVETILHLSGCLPVLVAMLAAGNPTDPGQVEDPSDDAVERFLKWEEPRRRQVALDAALPRRLNRDIFNIVIDDPNHDLLFEWLIKRLPFVQTHTDGWIYHEVVRAPMIRHKRRDAPKDWSRLHGRLAEYYEDARDDLGLGEKEGRSDVNWQRFELEALYHRLCESPQKHIALALDEFIAAFETQTVFALQLATTIQQAVEDDNSATLFQLSSILIEGVKAHQENRLDESIRMLTAMLEFGGMSKSWLAEALVKRGRLYMQGDQHTSALSDFTEAVKVAPENATYWLERSRANLSLGHKNEAVDDIEAASNIEPLVLVEIAAAITS